MKARLLFVSTPISPIGAGDGGGVETTLKQITPILAAKGYQVTVLAPTGSRLPPGALICEINGTPPPNATTSVKHSAVIITADGVLEGMWQQAAQMQDRFDVIISMSYDWLSYYLTPFLSIPVLHWVTIGSCLRVVDTAIAAQYQITPTRFAFYSKAQASTFSFVDLHRTRILPGAVDLDRFHFQPKPGEILLWVARISPEKGLEAAVKAADGVGVQLHVCGKIQDETYWENVNRLCKPGQIIYHGLLPHHRLQELLGRALAMLVTPTWVEAFGMTVVEALACGTPVIAYDRGAPKEIIEDGKSGFLVPQDDIASLISAIKRIPSLARANARNRAEHYGVDKLVERVEAWIADVLRSG